MANIKLKALGGLYNDYNGIFNLNAATAPTNILIDIITDGDQYVENSDSGYAHGGSSAYREFEGVLPLTNNEAIWEEYGSKFAKKAVNYFKNKITAYLEGELWDVGMYTKYTNQFSVDFEDGNNQNTINGGVSPYDGYEYVSYTGVTTPFNTKTILTRNLDVLSSEGMEITASIIHFSKYYNIHIITSGELKILRPLLYYEDDLTTYNMALNSSGVPYVNSYLNLAFWRESHSRRRECVHNVISTYQNDGYPISDLNYRTITNDYARTGSGHDWSQFHTNPASRPTFTDWDTNNWNQYVAEGFHLFGWWGGLQYYICKGNDSDDAVRNLPAPYASIYDWDKNTFNGEINGQGNGSTAFIGILYKSDSGGSLHMFNTYFPVRTTGSNNYIITDNIKYRGTNTRYPATIGTMIASILANIYVYKDENSSSVKYISDIIYLTPNSTTYTKDVVFRTHVNPELADQNELLLFHKRRFNEYVNTLKEFVNESTDDKDGKFNDNNVTLQLKEGIKNVPLQFKLDYIEPNLAVIGEYATVKLHNILGEEKDLVTGIVKSNELYLIDDNDLVNYLNNDFRIKWLDKLEVVDNKLHAKDSKWAELPVTLNSYLRDMFTFKSGKLDFKTTEVITSRTGKNYAVYSRNGSYGNVFHDMLVNDILVPSARVV